jgi:uroporphyrinogen-III synthase
MSERDGDGGDGDGDDGNDDVANAAEGAENARNIGDAEDSGPRVAVFRPDDDRLAAAVSLLDGLAVAPIPDPMLAIEPSGETPRTDAEYAILTSRTGAELIAEAGWEFEGTLCAIGERTAEALRAEGYDVEVVPREFSSTGLIEALRERVPGARVEVARSDHGSPVLLDGLGTAGAYVHETVLYSLVRPAGSGVSAERAAAGDLDGALFTSSLTVSNFLAAARERGIESAAKAGLNEAIVGAIGEPTRETATAAGIEVEVVPERAAFDALARAVVARLDP